MSKTHEVVIVGAGFSGMAAAIKLKEAGIDDFVILERKDEVGGVWRDNTYPGVAVDVPSFTYSYAFEPNPSWSRTFAPGNELLDYAKHCSDKYDLRRHLRFHSDVRTARFDESEHLWVLELASGDRVSGRYLISAHGPLVTPQKPSIPGLDDFQGHVIYTMEWDHEHSLDGKRVAVIGTGASGLQVIPAIAPEVGTLTVFQRTPIWVLPKVNPPINRFASGLLAHVPGAAAAARLSTSAATEALLLSFIYNKQVPFAVKSIEQLCRAHLRSQVPDPEVRRKLTPTYGFGCKRPSFSNSYFPTFLRDNVELVTDGIERITPTGIRTVDGVEREIDTLVLATGFKVLDVPYDLHGVDGETLLELWARDRKQSYQGVTVHGFPNLFLSPGAFGLAGPSLFATFDLCHGHALRVIKESRRRGATRVEVSQVAQEHWMEKMRARVGHTIFNNPSCAGSNSYYVDEHGDSAVLRPTSTVNAWLAQHRFPFNAYRFEEPSAPAVSARRRATRAAR
ncbi:NAD(P)/FAD-dependent oxidoreductase [Nocardioides humilatus]|uniref:NAD(P)/FAD-dependent oxidoreductase n=1 Tax=Nocardioides humilatus TaxID=2607660 RepID=A0A5B1LAZ5_9ACTN|nr:NAD(P)/FAD-dependent oxidoreductase [Nocardioides humilatus]KAA1416950.1 NAD(P)/FAD-dependent oxidoreductase [Nocardioides humilatus]